MASTDNPDDNSAQPVGDGLRQMVRGEVSRQVEETMSKFLPEGGIPELMKQIAGVVTSQIELPQIDYDFVTKKTLDMARSEMGEQANKIGAEIEAKAAGAGGGNLNGATGGDGHDHGGEGDQGGSSSPPEGYKFAKVTGAANMAQALKMSMYSDPFTAVNFLFDKIFMSIDKWGAVNRPDDVTLLQKIRTAKPELFNMFVPNPWGPEFQRMQQDTWSTAMKVRMAQMGPYGPVDPSQAYNPFVSGGPPNAGYEKPSDEPRKPLFGETVSASESSAPSTRATVPGTTQVLETPKDSPKSMAEMMVANL